MFETYQQEKQKSIPYKENPETYVPDIKEIDKMRKDELVRYARSLSAECIEVINKDINRTMITKEVFKIMEVFLSIRRVRRRCSSCCCWERIPMN